MQIWVRFPKFIVGFVAASFLFSFVLAPLFASLFDGDGLKLVESSVIKAVTNPLRGWFFCLAFVSIGLESNFKELAKQMEGGKPMLLYVVGQSFNLILTLAVAWLAFIGAVPERDLTLKGREAPAFSSGRRSTQALCSRNSGMERETNAADTEKPQITQMNADVVPLSASICAICGLQRFGPGHHSGRRARTRQLTPPPR